MHIIDLLEKRERTIYQLYLRLMETGAASNLKEVCHLLTISKSTCLRYITSFNEDAIEGALGLEFLLEDEEVRLRRKPTLSLQEFLGYLCKTSLKYQLLLYLFDKNEFSTTYLAQELLISEATLNRQLASLNQILKEFQLTIRNGRLKGSELQIRYFYYQLLWLTSPLSILKEDRVFRDQEKLLPIFERYYNSTFNPRQAQQLALWLTIVQKRIRLKDVDFGACYQLMKPYEEHKFYRNLRQLFLTISQQFAVPFQEGDTMSVFAFLFSQRILEAHQLEQVLGFGGPIMEATTWGFQQLKQSIKTELAVEEGGLYHLNQLFSHLYFFTCRIDSNGSTIVGKNLEQLAGAREIIGTVQQKFYGQSSVDVGDYALESLLQLYDYLLQVEPTSVHIGLASSYHPVITWPILQLLRQQLERNRSIVLDLFEEEVSYDLIISYDYPLEKENVYYLYDSPALQDLVDLKQIIQKLHREKLEQSKRLVERSRFQIERR